eukprot:TRINITY_DN1865_c0_g1_i4.p3 TRINITY_DN1865_c0_g1~~TRINITY_DN1865_c0_g1_i4.p3  ORF type:complete len:205 (-),score=55.89 TRINITY_DN1865_c0_g1_i4:38-652(-)
MAAKATVPLKLAVFMSSVRQGRLCDRVTKYTVNKLQARGHTTDIFDPKELKLPMLEVAHHHYAFFGQQPPAELDAVAKRIQAADAIVVVSAEYNHSIPPALTNLMGHFGPAGYLLKPAGIVTYSSGPFAGLRAAMQLRAFLGELGSNTVGTILAVPNAGQSISETGVLAPSAAPLEPTADKMIAQIEWIGAAFKNYKATVPPPK